MDRRWTVALLYRRKPAMTENDSAPARPWNRADRHRFCLPSTPFGPNESDG